jgi:two-component system osmolarity sensor histidine kinase EnvZ
LSSDGYSVCVDVSDEGPGIPEASLQRVFDPFFRLETSRNRETGGVGLGLSAARAIVREQGGELTLSNRSSGGLQARVELPL